MRWAFLVMGVTAAAACGGGGIGGNGGAAGGGAPGSGGTPGGAPGGVALPPAPACATAGGSVTVAKPAAGRTLADPDEDQGWLSSPAIADLDGDGKSEVVAARDGRVLAWRSDGAPAWTFDARNGRIWSSVVVGDFTGDAKLEVAFAARGKVWLLDAAGKVMPGFPVTWQDELRSLAAGDLDGDGRLDLVAGTGRSRPDDVVNAWRADGSPVAGFPPNAKGVLGCKVGTDCWFAGLYDQNLAVGDLDGDGKADVVAPHDNAYASILRSTGAAFEAASIYGTKTKSPGVRYLHALEDAKKGFAEDEDTALQAHFTNTAPAIADLDGDGKPEIVMLGSVQNASQDNRKQGVGLWALEADASRHAGWETPFHAKDYVAGLDDFEGTNVVGATNQVTVADIDPSKPGPELVFAGFDGRIHAVSAARAELWAVRFTTDPRVLTGGVLVADLSGDGIPEVVFATYSPDKDKSSLHVLDAGGNELHKVALPGRGAMAVPTLGDLDGDGALEVVVSLKDGGAAGGVRVFTIATGKTNCLLWPTGRANTLRNGWIRSPSR